LLSTVTSIHWNNCWAQLAFADLLYMYLYVTYKTYNQNSTSHATFYHPHRYLRLEYVLLHWLRSASPVFSAVLGIKWAHKCTCSGALLGRFVSSTLLFSNISCLAISHWFRAQALLHPHGLTNTQTSFHQARLTVFPWNISRRQQGQLGKGLQQLDPSLQASNGGGGGGTASVAVLEALVGLKRGCLLLHYSCNAFCLFAHTYTKTHTCMHTHTHTHSHTHRTSASSSVTSRSM
jgi:hypothetical protein